MYVYVCVCVDLPGRGPCDESKRGHGQPAGPAETTPDNVGSAHSTRESHTDTQ